MARRGPLPHDPTAVPRQPTAALRLCCGPHPCGMRADLPSPARGRDPRGRDRVRRFFAPPNAVEQRQPDAGDTGDRGGHGRSAGDRARGGGLHGGTPGAKHPVGEGGHRTVQASRRPLRRWASTVRWTVLRSIITPRVAAEEGRDGDERGGAYGGSQPGVNPLRLERGGIPTDGHTTYKRPPPPIPGIRNPPLSICFLYASSHRLCHLSLLGQANRPLPHRDCSYPPPRPTCPGTHSGFHADRGEGGKVHVGEPLDGKSARGCFAALANPPGGAGLAGFQWARVFPHTQEPSEAVWHHGGGRRTIEVSVEGDELHHRAVRARLTPPPGGGGNWAGGLTGGAVEVRFWVGWSQTPLPVSQTLRAMGKPGDI